MYRLGWLHATVSVVCVFSFFRNLFHETRPSAPVLAAAACVTCVCRRVASAFLKGCLLLDVCTCHVWIASGLSMCGWRERIRWVVLRVSEWCCVWSQPSVKI